MTVQKFIFFLIIPAGLVSFFLSIIMMGPKSIDYENIDYKSVPHEAVNLLAEKSVELEGDFETLHAINPLSEEAHERLFEAIVFQKEYIAALPYYNKNAEERLLRLEARHDQVVSEAYYKISLAKERASNELYQQEAYKKAQVLASEAMENQLIINEQFPLSSHNDLNRLAQLKRQVKYLEAYPIFERLTGFVSQADSLAQSEQWEEAADLIQEAIDLQSVLNSDYRTSKLADSTRLFNLKKRYVDLLSERTYRKGLKLIDQADQLSAGGEYLKAAAGYNKALEVQRALNKNFPTSQYASEDVVRNLVRKSQTSESYFLAENISAMNFAIDSDLKNRNTSVAKEKIIRITNLILRMKEAFPKSSYYDDNLELKINFLNFIRNDLDLIQSRIYDLLLPIPEEDFKMLKTEVTQALYATIMGVNPSRKIGELMPVESVSWVDANEFCQRLSWILGRTVRLPKEYELRHAIGRLKYLKIEEYAISTSDESGLSEVASKEPLASGYYDLLGNVSEWLYSEGAVLGENVNHIGGHFADNNRIIFSVPLRDANKNERSRLIGFRFVVEL